MKKLAFAVTILICCINMKCESNEDDLIDASNLLIGNWSEVQYDKENITFKRQNSLPENTYGISFRAKGNLVERSSGWCGTPPLHFSDYNGTWELTENVITITQNHFPNNYVWRIISVTETELVVTKALSEQEQDYRILMSLFDDINELIDGIACENAEDWAFAPYGSKSCGGPQGYVAYPKSIDVEAFLEKVEIYTQAENEYNIKWSVFSTCDITPQPTAVVCENGFPILKY
ncbi:lipocalin-like domain-containing protein [Hyunsoonleella pacifica]|uniref:Lipocalin-like domain-containing protein n=1 Tax=Hyunsoonleella pacifica TaxID=1080224 RepID=A0A4Q9FP52_9FLAO|nr:lipocalin family protein [Hyunsoonleella pacifica]TBN14442.1 hypothetical protein EYD46_12780 [Hyunsoonleella pacifica]GGD13783.1 hypothetical protein GCM10011368_14700 [Hyunsoonleella pacifica]